MKNDEAEKTELRTQGLGCGNDEPTVHTGKKKCRAETIVIEDYLLVCGLDGF